MVASPCPLKGNQRHLLLFVAIPPPTYDRREPEASLAQRTVMVHCCVGSLGAPTLSFSTDCHGSLLCVGSLGAREKRNKDVVLVALVGCSDRELDREQ